MNTPFAKIVPKRPWRAPATKEGQAKKKAFSIIYASRIGRREKQNQRTNFSFASTKVWRVTADPLYSDAVVTEAHARQHNRRGFDNGPPRRPGLRMGATRPWDTIRTQYSATWAKIAFRKYYEQGAAATVPVRFHGASPAFRLSTRRHVSASPTATRLERVCRAHPRRRPPPPPGGRCEAAPPPLYLVGVGLCISPPPPPSRALPLCWHARVRSGV